MQSLRISQVPVLSSDGRFAGLHTLRDLLGSDTKPHCAIVMAGGRGERLRPLTDSVPKPMVRVAGRPILERLILHLVGSGIRRIFISVNYKAEVIEAHFRDGESFGCSIGYLRERMPLGSGGSLSLLPELPSCPSLVLNGDLVTQFDVTGMLAFHEENGYLATIGIHEYAHTVPYGVVELDGDRVIQHQEKPTSKWRVNTGIYVLDPELLRRVPSDTYFALPTLIEWCLDAGDPIGAFHVGDDWVDIGRHPELKSARGEG
jgi:NDP-sugar pyrophosphorylase family protein